MLTFIKILLFSTFYLQLLTQCRTRNYCSARYCNNSKEHTLCKYPSEEPGTNCLSFERTIFNSVDKRLLLDKINSRRNKVASGEIRSLPPAAGMKKLEWNSELELSAQRWADQCMKHRVPDLKDTCRDLIDMHVGQNIATVQGDSPGLTPIALVDVWYMELLKLNTSVISRYVPSSETGEPHYDYFTQLVWEQSAEVGCGGVKFKERLGAENFRTIYRLVCNFAPAGNRRNKTVYSCGSPCSGCPDGVCDHDFKALCEHTPNTNEENSEDVYDESTSAEIVSFENTTKNNPIALVDSFFDSKTTPIVDILTEIESVTTFDYYPHLYDTKLLRESITPATKDFGDKEALLNEFIELLKKKLNSDPVIKDLLLTTTAGNPSSSEISFDDENVAAFVSRIYSKKGLSTTKITSPIDYVNSTLLVDLIEAVIFRSNDKIATTEMVRQEPQTLPVVKPVKIQAELAEVKPNKEFSGHYFFPEEEDESTTEITNVYYDNTNFAQSDVEMEIEQLKMSSITRDFLDDIFESETIAEKISQYTNNIDRKYLKPLKRRKRGNGRISRNKSQDFEYTFLPYKLSKRDISNCVKSNDEHKSYLNYTLLLRKIAADIRKLKLNQVFHCARNKSENILFRSTLLFFVSLLLY